MFLPKTPFSQANHCGIAIKSSGVQVMTVANNGDIKSSAHQYFKTPLIVGESIDTNQLRLTVKQILEEANITQKFVAVTIPEKLAYSKEHLLPNLSNSEIEEAINWQIEKIFPFSRKEVYSDWKLISKDKAEIKVMATVIPRGIIDQLKTSLEAAGLSPISFEPSASALTRLIQPEDNTTMIILELENTTTTASLVINGIAVFTSTTSFTPNTPPEQVMHQVTTSIQGIYLHLNKIDQTPKDLTMTITGEQANQNISDYLQQTLQMPCQLMQVKDISPKDHLAYIAASVNILPPESEKSINLIPPNVQTFYQELINYHLSRRITEYVAAISITGLLISSFMFGFIFWSKVQSQNQLNLARQQTQLVGTNQFDLGEVNKKSQRIINLYPKKVSPEQYLVSIYNIIPENVTLRQVSLSENGKNIRLTGTVSDRETILSLRDAITATGIFTTPKIPLTSYQDLENTPFELSFQVKTDSK